jgi:hypothetical protein
LNILREIRRPRGANPGAFVARLVLRSPAPIAQPNVASKFHVGDVVTAAIARCRSVFTATVSPVARQSLVVHA